MSYEERESGHAQQVTMLFDQYRDPLYGYLLRLVGERESANDLTQELFVRALRQDDLDHIENPRAWLYRVATNLAFDLLRRRRRLRWLPLYHAESVPAARTPPVSDEVSRSLAALPPDIRAALLLYAAYGFSTREIAGLFNCSEGAMRTRLFRAREQFRAAYAKESNDE